ncbi:MAG: HD domain-containing phosphohydrolase [Elstera sp.]
MSITADRTVTAETALKRLIEIGTALAAERNPNRLLEQIIVGAKELSNADGGTLYLTTETDGLRFVILRNDTLGFAKGGTTGEPVQLPDLPLHRPDGSPNHNNVATYTALTRKIVNIDDAYHAKDFDFSGTKRFDETTGYRSQSFLTVPLCNHLGDVVGVLQLINRKNPITGVVDVFGADLVPLIEALASQAAMALTNQQLILEQRNLFDAFINLMAGAIDAKSPYTGGHCQRVPALTEMLAAAACRETEGPFSDFDLNDDQWYELRVAGGLHDVGKVTTPVHIMDKATKLEKICDRIEEIRARHEVLRRDAQIAYWRGRVEGGDEKELAKTCAARIAEIDEQFLFLRQVNFGTEFTPDASVDRIKAIATQTWGVEGELKPLLLEDEVMNLCIRRGTLNNEDRKIINDHIVLTIQMLDALPFPKLLKNVSEIAGGHHEKMDGTGYPKGLKRHEMSIPARMMGIADIFEALTAADRPYKKPKPISESIAIMARMKQDNHVDPDLFDLFLRSGVYRDYAEKFLQPDQIDDVDITQYIAPNFNPKGA